MLGELDYLFPFFLIFSSPFLLINENNNYQLFKENSTNHSLVVIEPRDVSTDTAINVIFGVLGILRAALSTLISWLSFRRPAEMLCYISI